MAKKSKLSGPTPGPWNVGGVDENIWIERQDKNDACICDIVQSGYDKDSGEVFYQPEDKANARLIAAAPILLALLIELKESHYGAAVREDYENRVEAALQSASGSPEDAT